MYTTYSEIRSDIEDDFNEYISTDGYDAIKATSRILEESVMIIQHGWSLEVYVSVLSLLIQRNIMISYVKEKIIEELCSYSSDQNCHFVRDVEYIKNHMNSDKLMVVDFDWNFIQRIEMLIRE